MISLSNSALLEISDLSHQAEILARSNSASDRAVASVYLQRISAIKQAGISSDEMRGRYSIALSESLSPRPQEINEARYTKAFYKYIAQGNSREAEAELRTILAGQESVFYSMGSVGGYTVPLKTAEEVYVGMSELDPVLSPLVTDFVQEPTSTLQPLVLSGYDLSGMKANLTTESSQLVSQPFPAIGGGKVLRASITYRCAVEATVESDTDIPNLSSKIATAFGVAFGRSLGQDALTGSGSNEPLGLLTSLTSPVYSTGSGKIVLDDLLAIYFSVNRYWRAKSLCSWLVHDTVYQRIRQATDSVGHPLISLVNDKELLLGKPIHVSPSMTAVGGSPSTNGLIAFGSFSELHLRCSRPTFQRVLNSSISDITQGKIMFVGRIRFDSQLFDASGGSFPPVVTATVVN